MTKVYFIRHGETDANRDRIIQGTMDYKLSEEGEKQIAQLGKRFAKVHIDKIYSSPLSRTVKTALAVMNGRNIELVKDEGFIEFDFGLCQGLSHSEIAARFPEVYESFNNCFYKTQAPEGESYADLYERGWAATQRVVAENKDKTIVVTSHGGTIRAIILRILYNDMTRLDDVPRIRNTAVFEVDFHDDGSIEIITSNDDSHLEKKAADRLEI
jgi:broad specificity phosphatase PhoE